ncbi:DUF2188 domain-containing protein [Cupriavidus necator]|uniref:DUF2188 domain-containing protein n=1 Tax=Cupriavidus necator TaxID=106590 RepID=UPI001E62A3E8|nr:DUF2188 domain-containing protein [Cupriavidus necator]
MSANIYVVPARDEWTVETAWAREREMFRKQDEAISAATERARRSRVDLLIHGRAGHIEMRISYRRNRRESRD